MLLRLRAKPPLTMLALSGILAIWAIPGFAQIPTTTPAESQQATTQAAPDTRAILEQVDAAARAVRAVSYKAKYFGNGPISEDVPQVEGTVCARREQRSVIGGLLGNTGDQFRFTGTALMPGSDDRLSFDMAANAKEVQSLDHQNKAFTHGSRSKADALLHLPMRLWMIEFLHNTPFSDELGAKSREYEGTRKIGDVECDVIYVKYADIHQSESRWFFSRQDHLPRRVERIVKKDGLYKGAGVLEIYELNTSPKFSHDTFNPKCPAGYSESEIGELLRIGSAAPDWALSDADGKIITLRSLRGRVVVMDFWATWCGPCKLSMPDLQALHEEFKDQPVTILGVNCSDKGDAKEFMKKNGLTYPLLLQGEQVAKQYNLTGLPTYYIIDPEGRIAHRCAGLKPDKKEQIREVILKLLPPKK